MPIVLKKPAGTAGSSWPAIAVGLFVAFGGVLFGYEAVLREELFLHCETKTWL